MANTEPVNTLTVDSATIVAEDVVSIVLSDPSGADLPAWTPGAHIDIVLADGIVRQYSLCSDPADTKHYRIGVLKAPNSRGGSIAVHRDLTAGASVTVTGPRNHFELAPASNYIFVAGGIGITPILTMIRAAEAAGSTWTLLYGGRTTESMAYLDELEQYGDRVTLLPGAAIEPMLEELEARLGTPQADTLIYTCGPEGLLQTMEKMSQPWPKGALHLERFTAKKIEGPEGGEREFDVVLSRAGKTIHVPANRSIFDAIQDAGISMMGSCKEGICGTCETFVIEGIPDHRDSVLNDDEKASNETMMPCVSRSCTDTLVLDI